MAYRANWYSIGDVSAFARVPSEVLGKILTFALVAEGDVRPYASVTRDDQFKQIHGTKSENLSPNSFLPILLVNKRFYHQGIAIAYRDNSFNFTSIATYAAFVISLKEISKRSKASAKKITKVSITLDVAGDTRRISDLWSFIYPRHLELCILTASFCDIALRELFRSLPYLSHLQVCTSLFQCTYKAPNSVKRTTRLQPMMPTCRNMPETRLQHINFAFDNPLFIGRKKAKRTHQVLLYSQLRHDLMVPGIYRTFTLYLCFVLKEYRKSKKLEAAAQLAASSDPSALSSLETSDEPEQPESSAVPAPAPAPAAET